jgi:soluble lytic murein transglycosylase-like protein
MQKPYVRKLGMAALMSFVLWGFPPAIAEGEAVGDASEPVASASVDVAKPSPTSRVEGPPRVQELIASHARRHGVPVALARAVVRLESNFNPRARGRAGEIGLMQIKPQTARGIGYTGASKALYDPDTNLSWGMRYLGTAYALAGGSVCGTILRYNAGHYAKRMNPVSRRYCQKVLALMGHAGKEAKESYWGETSPAS